MAVETRRLASAGCWPAAESRPRRRPLGGRRDSVVCRPITPLCDTENAAWGDTRADHFPCKRKAQCARASSKPVPQSLLVVADGLLVSGVPSSSMTESILCACRRGTHRPVGAETRLGLKITQRTAPPMRSSASNSRPTPWLRWTRRSAANRSRARRSPRSPAPAPPTAETPKRPASPLAPPPSARERHPDIGAPTGAVGGVGGAAMRLGDEAGDREAEAGAAT
jgi:hypothetical protein